MLTVLAALLLSVSPVALHASGVRVQAIATAPATESELSSSAANSGVPVPVAAQYPLMAQAERSAAASNPSRPDGLVADALSWLNHLEQRMPWSNIPMVRDVPAGPHVVAAGDTVTGPVASRGGPLDIFGVVNGDAVAYEGDVILHPGAVVTGDVIAVLGRVQLRGGAVGGEVRSVRGLVPPTWAQRTTPAASPPTVGHQLGLIVGWLTMLILIGVGVLVFASGPLNGVIDTLQGGFSRALLLGLAGQLAVLPVLLLVVVALAVTVIGILLIPFAIVAIALGTAGLMMLGFLAVAAVTGSVASGNASRRRLSERGAALRALVVGIVLFVAVWLVAALLTSLPTAAAIARGVAFVLTWVAVTAGFGAALRSRAGTRRTSPPPAGPEPEEELSWLTPTPIGGVVAARRPSSSAR